MSVRGILRYSGGALLFAAVVCGLWLAARRLASKRPRPAEVLAVQYLAALVQITALRIGLAGHRWLGGTINPVPLETTLGAWREGPWTFVYHVAGNLIWFVPLGLLLPMLAPQANGWRVLLAGAGLSLGIEIAQYLLGTGYADVDDVLLNALGALAGCGLLRRLRRR